MAKLITKFKYIKPTEKAGEYLKYIATREGVDKIDDSKKNLPATVKQKQLIDKLLLDFPDSKEMHEYEDYRSRITIGTATEFITRTLEDNASEMMNSKTYADYIATRPRAQRFGEHGLFTDDGVAINLSKVSKELNVHKGNVWTAIMSLRREDAARLGFDNGCRWRDMLRTQTQTLSEALKIPMENLRWYAAFHNESHHPHIHLIAYSVNESEGYLSPKGVNKLRSSIAKDILHQDLLSVYEKQTEHRNTLKSESKELITELITKINNGIYDLSLIHILLILGNSGQGKSYLLKLIITNIRESGKHIICLDPEGEYKELCDGLGGCYIDFLSGEYTINPLEPKAWSEQAASGSDNDGVNMEVSMQDGFVPDAFKKATKLSQHIAFLKDFFRSYKDFSDAQIDTIEILLTKLYARFGITDATDYGKKLPTDFPIMQDFYKLCEEEFMTYDKSKKYLYTEETLQEVCLGINSMCVGAESRYFNGHTNITDDDMLVFGVKGLLDTNKRLKDAMLFNILSFMSNQLLGKGNTAASIDELYLFLTNMTAIEYIRNAMKRVRKKDSSIILASQNIEDFLIPSIREYTKPLFSIPTHQFLFNAGQINPKEYMDALQVEPSEFELIKYPERGTCLYRCGNERYLLQVIAPDYKSALFGKAGGR